ncbi:hypothetical protein J0A67_15880 [Algoriphagus aestuariicola]|jgi:opacity protein-like surface antigen|uniref:Uncharacterized protein n=1 Tax=Algoriphagus aestuariicola TaxID=1852016 RepID=A0ABS3BSU5_9BACT|nr:hypothetical protein [Algoriphagus aestuariicola]MBN7802352.1 hypothetical protein [Algoriphagus aestuariicola]
MKKSLLIACFMLLSAAAFSQTTVAFHQSNLPFIGVNHQFGEKWIPELRIGTDNYVEDLGFELIGNYMLKSEESTQIYIGAGIRANLLDGAVITSGINYFPFNRKDFGFHIEAAPIISFDEGALFRGSFGIRYRFLKD